MRLKCRPRDLQTKASIIRSPRVILTNYCFSGAPLEGYDVAIRDARRTMWIQVGMVGADVTRLQIKELHVSLPCARGGGGGGGMRVCPLLCPGNCPHVRTLWDASS